MEALVLGRCALRISEYDTPSPASGPRTPFTAAAQSRPATESAATRH